MRHIGERPRRGSAQTACHPPGRCPEARGRRRPALPMCRIAARRAPSHASRDAGAQRAGM